MAQNKVTSLIIPGPPTSAVNYSQARDALLQHPEFPKTANVAYDLQDINGQWVASIAIAAPFPPSGGDEDSGPPGGSDGPPSPDESPDGPPSDDSDSDDEAGPPSDEGDDGEKPKKEKGEKGGEHKELSEIHQMLQAISLALGIPIPDASGATSPVPGADEGPPPPGPDGGPPGAPPAPESHADHPLHPGDTPGGGTPLGAPAFASVHPWAHIKGKVASFQVDEPLGINTLDQAQAELRSLAAESGFKVKRVRQYTGEDGPHIAATISAY